VTAVNSDSGIAARAAERVVGDSAVAGAELTGSAATAPAARGDGALTGPGGDGWFARDVGTGAGMIIVGAAAGFAEAVFTCASEPLRGGWRDGTETTAGAANDGSGGAVTAEDLASGATTAGAGDLVTVGTSSAEPASDG
jgi:hypothetical protein